MIAVSSFVIALSGALVPGPLFTITVGESLKRGFSAGPLIILGHGILEFLVVCLFFFGLTPLFAGAGVKATVGTVGGMVLIAMGAMILRDAGRSSLQYLVGEKKTGLHPVVSGIIGSLSNPYWVIWWITIGLGYLVSAVRFGLAGITAFFLGHILADLAWYSLVSFAVSRGRKVLGEKGYRVLLYACGVFLMAFGVWFIKGA